jgi:hypothetical protein
MDSVRSSSCAKGASAAPCSGALAASFSARMARSASDTTATVSSGSGPVHSDSGAGTNASYPQARRCQGGA